MNLLTETEREYLTTNGWEELSDHETYLVTSQLEEYPGTVIVPYVVGLYKHKTGLLGIVEKSERILTFG